MKKISKDKKSIKISPIFNYDLEKGIRGKDVKRLQQLLNSDPDTVVAENGPGSPGRETNYYGSLTVKAVTKFQLKHMVNGRVGPETRAVLRKVFSTISSAKVILPQSCKGLSEEQVKKIMPNLSSGKCREYMPFLIQAMNEFEINTPLRIATFVSQTAHESAEYTRMIESFNYSADRLFKVFPKYFTKEKAKMYARKPQKIANYVYANRMGNGNEASGDGWKYRGRGAMQLTGKSKYKECGTSLAVDLVASPGLVGKLEYIFRSAAWFWDSKNLNMLADRGNFKEITRKINGGFNGLENRIRYYAKAKAVMGIS